MKNCLTVKTKMLKTYLKLKIYSSKRKIGFLKANLKILEKFTTKNLIKKVKIQLYP